MKKMIALFAAIALLLAVTGAAAEGTAEDRNGTIDWGGMGSVAFSAFGDMREDLQPLVRDDTPQGKLVYVEFSILDDAYFNFTDAMNYAHENVKMNGADPFKIGGTGAKFENGLVSIGGTIDVFFDVPEDFDLAQAVVTLKGEELPKPAAE